MGLLYSSNENNGKKQIRVVEEISTQTNNPNATFSPNEEKMAELVTDAIPPLRNPTLTLSLTTEQVKKIESELEFYEMVSIVYLLYDNPMIALQKLQVEQCGGARNALTEWAIIEQRKNPNWNKKLVEGLCIIQNYKILKSLGLDKNALREQLLPHVSSASVFVDVLKKELYRIVDNLTDAETDELIALVEGDFKAKKLRFERYDYEQSLTELYLLHWETEKYFSTDDLGNLAAIFKQMEKDEFCEALKKYTRNKNETVWEANGRKDAEIDEWRLQERLMLCPEKKKYPRKVCDTLPEDGEESLGAVSNGSASSPNSWSDEKDKYPIDARNPGIVIIINQVNFYTEVDPRYQHLLPPRDSDKLEDRVGSEKDCCSLEEAFKYFGFKVVVKEDLPHNQILHEIESVLEKVDSHSSVFVCILSHGIEGVIYGNNSCEVEVQEIINVMGTTNKKNLNNKPKVLILQSCQGRNLQVAEEAITVDGPSKKVKLSARDMLIFWSTVPNYAAIRDKERGTWFIQSLCESMKLYKDKHFLDICTRASGSVVGKRWKPKNESYCMTPYKTDTFTKDFYLPYRA